MMLKLMELIGRSKIATVRHINALRLVVIWFMRRTGCGVRRGHKTAGVGVKELTRTETGTSTGQVKKGKFLYSAVSSP